MDKICGASDKADFLMPGQIIRLNLQSVRKRIVVGIHPGNEFTVCKVKTFVQRKCEPLVCFVLKANAAGIGGRDLLEYFVGFIAAAVVRNDQLKILIRTA